MHIWLGNASRVFAVAMDVRVAVAMDVRVAVAMDVRAEVAMGASVCN